MTNIFVGLLLLSPWAWAEKPENLQESANRGLTEYGTVPTQDEIAAALEAFLQLPREELTWQTWDFSTDGELSLDMQEVELPLPFIGGSVQTRAFGDLPGVIMRVKPGGSLKFTLNNKLGTGPGKSTCGGSGVGLYESPNMTCLINTTNIHMHGIHASPEGKEDNVFVKVAPGESRAYDIKIPEFHMGGTHFYHPHLHHSTALQTGGGAHGMLIVDDPEGSLPQMVEDMPDIPLMMSLIQPVLLMRTEQFGLSTHGSDTESQRLWINSLYPDWRWANMPLWLSLGEPIWFTVNGQYRPKVSIEEGRWYRLRFCQASIDWHTRVFENSSNCEFQLLAKDGVYLHEAVRPVDMIHLASGARADVAMRCFVPEAVRQSYQETNETHLSTLLWSSYQMRVEAMTPLQNSTGELLSFSVTPRSEADFDADLEVFSVRRPCYLADLRNAPAEDLESNRHSIWMTHNMTNELPYPVWPWLEGTMEMYVDDVLRVWGHTTPEPVFTVPVGELVEFNMSGLHHHNFHGHVNPYQIQAMDVEDPWYKVGDWQDTIYPFLADNFIMRQNTDYYTGRAIIHCHLLLHEDNGMMAYYNITGEEGTRYPAKEKLDPTCYEGAYPQETTTTDLAVTTAPATTTAPSTGELSTFRVEIEASASDSDAFDAFLTSTSSDWLSSVLASLTGLSASTWTIGVTRKDDVYAIVGETPVSVSAAADLELDSIVSAVWSGFASAVAEQEEVASESWTISEVSYVGVSDSSSSEAGYRGTLPSWSTIGEATDIEADAARPRASPLSFLFFFKESAGHFAFSSALLWLVAACIGANQLLVA